MERPGLPAVRMRRLREAMLRLAARHRHRARMATAAALMFAWLAMAAVVMLALRWGSG